ncbi:MAG TPA: LysM peptidoglycan-binding domain-containing protein [Opitutaceae bacterium]|nr:LysM peptidoglycan-binding domain-containing protein [Opitutaceae bacterium]
MTVRRLFVAALVLFALLGAAGCGGNDPVALGAETDERLYREGQQQRKNGRDSEALTSFLKVIERRGDRDSPEAHFEAGLIYLNHIKDPLEAIHHFRKYLEFKPTSPQAQGVRGLIDTAKREFARTLPARPMEDQSLRLDNADELERLRREVEELRAQNATLRGGGAVTPRSSSLPLGATTRPAGPSYAASSGPTINVPAPTRSVATEPPVFQPAPLPTAVPPPVTRPAAQPQATRPAAARPTTTTTATPTGGRVHNVAAKDSLWSIARQHYGAGVNAAKVRGIYEANRNVMKDEGDLRPGMTLRIP